MRSMKKGLFRVKLGFKAIVEGTAGIRKALRFVGMSSCMLLLESLLGCSARTRVAITNSMRVNLAIW